MKLSELLSRGRPTVSCELFLPKVGTTLDQVEGVLRDTAALRPDFISVTYGRAGARPSAPRRSPYGCRTPIMPRPGPPHLRVLHPGGDILYGGCPPRRGDREHLGAWGYPRDADFPSRNTTTMPVSSSATSEAWRAERSCASARLAIPRGTWNVPTGRTISIS